jgi:thymidylate synthase (FAD)
MRNVEIEIFQIAKTEVDRSAVRRWLDHLNATGYEIPTEDAVTDPALLIAMAAKRCYLSFEPGLNPNVTKVRSDMVAYLDNILKSGHGSVLEHSTYTFAIEGVSRVFTGEMNRHRAGVGISEASMRYIRYTDIPYWLPTSIQLTPNEEEALRVVDNSLYLREHDVRFPDAWKTVPEDRQAVTRLAIKKKLTQDTFHRAFGQDEKNYQELQDIWADELKPEAVFKDKKHITSMMRRIIPMGVATGGVWTMNLRALRHIIALRASEAAEEEILLVFSRIAKMMVESEPMLCGDFAQDENGFWAPKYRKV